MGKWRYEVRKPVCGACLLISSRQVSGWSTTRTVWRTKEIYVSAARKFEERRFLEEILDLSEVGTSERWTVV